MKLTFYRTPDCPGCSRIEDILTELNLANTNIIVLPADTLRKQLSHIKKLPVLMDNTKVFEGTDAIIKHLRGLSAFKELWYKFQSDACYCNEAGDIE